MTHAQSDALIQMLRDADLPLSEKRPSDETSASTPWFVRILHALSGWLASIFILLMFGAMFHRLFDSVPALLLIGVSLIGIAFALFRSPDRTLFLEHLALSLSLAGQALMGFAFFQAWGGTHFFSALPWLALALLELILFFAMRDSFHRLISAFLFGITLNQTAFFIGATSLFTPLIFGITVWIWLSEYRPPETLFVKQAAGYGLSLALLWIAGTGFDMGWSVYGMHARPLLYLNRPWLTALLNGAVFLFTAYRLMGNSLSGKRVLKIIALVSIVVITLVSTKMPGLSIAVTLLIVGFSRGNLVLQGLSIAALLWSVGHFYYALHTTLLVKSALLTGSGILLLILYVLFRLLTRDAPPTGEPYAH